MTERTNQQAHEHEEEHVCNPEFNLTNEYLKQVVPLLTELHAKCVEIGLPLALVITHANDDKGIHQGAAFNFNGCRTPKEFHAIEAIAFGSIPDFVLAMVLATTKRHKE